MKTSATQKHARMSPRKIRPYGRMIQGMLAENAVHQLSFAVGKAPEIILHVLKSAMSNAINTHDMAKESLKIASVRIDQGLVMKRFNPVSKGMAHAILKRSAHVTVVVEGDVVEVKNKKAGKKEVIKTISADEFVKMQGKEHSHNEQAIPHEELHKHDTPALPGGDMSKTHRRKSIG